METLNSSNVGDKTRQSLKWSLILQFAQKVVMFVSAIVLARILTPQDFGLVTMSITIDFVIQMASSMGVNSAVVHFQDNFKERLNASYWLIISSTVLFVGIQFIFAPVAASFYKAPLLADIIRVSAVALLINCSVSTHRSILIKNMDFKKLSILDATVNLGRTILSIILALMGFGVWSFIYPKIVGAIVNAISLWNMTRWVPSLNPCFKYWKDMFSYGKDVLLSNILDYCLNNSGYVLIGNYMGSVALGVYSFAQDKSMMVVNNIAFPVNMVTFPAFSKLQNEPEKLKSAFLNSLKLISIISFPYAIGQMVAGGEYISVIFGAKWHSSVLLFQIILCYAMLKSVTQTIGPILLGIGKSDVLVKLTLTYTPIYVASLFIGYKLANLTGVAIASSIVGVIGTFIFMSVLLKIQKWKFADVFENLAPAFNSSILMGLCILTVKNVLFALGQSQLLVLCAEVFTGIVSYVMAMKLFYPTDYDYVLENIVKFIGRKKKVEERLTA
ncbi:MAG: lipopolysaccharide biosynthesis protein [bacterium]